MCRYGRPISGREDYIQGMDRRYFYNVVIREPRMATYNRMILGELNGYRVRRKDRYCKEWPFCIIVALKGVPIQEQDTHFEYLKKAVKNPPCMAQ